jgi:Uma2 family endonuclease
MQALETPSTVAQTTISFSPLVKQYTLEEFWALPVPQDRSHYELIGGLLFMAPPPDWPHGEFDGRLNRLLSTFLTSHDWPGNIHHPREAIYTDKTYLEPDMMYVSEDLASKMGKRRTSAEIVFEYVSKSSATYDYTTKADTYLALGVAELWLVDSDKRWIEVRYRVVRDDATVWQIIRYEKGDFAESRVLEGWRVSVDELFEGLI